MTHVYEWLEGVNQPMEGILDEYDPMDQIIPLDLDEDDNAYFNMPHAWNAFVEQPQVDNEAFPIDPSLTTMTGPPAPTDSVRPL